MSLYSTSHPHDSTALIMHLRWYLAACVSISAHVFELIIAYLLPITTLTPTMCDLWAHVLSELPSAFACCFLSLSSSMIDGQHREPGPGDTQGYVLRLHQDHNVALN